VEGTRLPDNTSAADGLAAVDGSLFRALADSADFDFFMELSREADHASVNRVMLCARVATSFRSFDSAFSSSRQRP
jgi:hypothetical protein